MCELGLAAEPRLPSADAIADPRRAGLTPPLALDAAAEPRLTDERRAPSALGAAAFFSGSLSPSVFYSTKRPKPANSLYIQFSLDCCNCRSSHSFHGGVAARINERRSIVLD